LVFIVSALKKRRCKIVLTVHNPVQHEISGIIGIFEKKLFKLSDVIISHSIYGKEYLRKISGGKTVVHIPHGIVMREKYEKPFNKENYFIANLNKNRKYIVIPGNIRKYKGTLNIIEAWRMIKSKYPDVTLIIIGRLWGGSQNLFGKFSSHVLGLKRYSKRVMGLSDELKDDPQFYFKFGFFSNDEICYLFNISMLAVFPYTQFSGQSGIASEAVSFGVPVLVTKQGALPELTISNTFVSPNAEPEMMGIYLSAAIEALRNDKHKLLRKKQYEKSEENSWYNIALKHKRIYYKLR
jgi:glycosyltransferase involved in cell wall biosynthesis